MASSVLTIDGSIELTEPVELTEEEMEKVAGGFPIDGFNIDVGSLLVGGLIVGASAASGNPVIAGVGGALGGGLIGASISRAPSGTGGFLGAVLGAVFETIVRA